MDKTNEKDRAILVRPGVGVTAGIVQRSELRFSCVTIDQPTLIVVRSGEKTLQSSSGEWKIKGGEAVAIAGGQTFDITNRLAGGGIYDARWLVWDASLIDAFNVNGPVQSSAKDAELVGAIDGAFTATFDRALEAIGQIDTIPHDVACHRLSEVLIWLSLRGIRFQTTNPSTTKSIVRNLFASALDANWTVAAVATQLGMSEATLRRHLAAEGASLSDILVDARMSFAMKLLQSTDRPINRIALDVGYESPSRFAIRFRKRFGFAPTAIRGHQRESFPMANGDALGDAT